jgi:nucleoporin GLE1
MARGESPLASRLHSSPRLHYSPTRHGSPSRAHLAQLDLDDCLARLSVHDREQHEVYVIQKREFQQTLDAREEALAQTHANVIKESHASHELIRGLALKELEAHRREEEDKRRRLEEERQRAEEQQRRREEEEEARLKAEAERRARDEADRKRREKTEQEEAAKRAEADKARLAEEQRAKDVKAEEARKLKQQQQQEQERKREQEARVAAEAEAAAKQAAESAKTSSSQDFEAEHRNYLVIHQRLKQLRTSFWDMCKANKEQKEYKKTVGEMRRELKGTVALINPNDPEVNKQKVISSHLSLLGNPLLTDL